MKSAQFSPLNLRAFSLPCAHNFALHTRISFSIRPLFNENRWLKNLSISVTGHHSPPPPTPITNWKNQLFRIHKSAATFIIVFPFSAQIWVLSKSLYIYILYLLPFYFNSTSKNIRLCHGRCFHQLMGWILSSFSTGAVPPMSAFSKSVNRPHYDGQAGNATSWSRVWGGIILDWFNWWSFTAS